MSDVRPPGWEFLKRLALLAGAPAIGVVLALVLLDRTLIPTMGLGDAERIRRLGQHLDSPLAGSRTMAILGDSVVMEGVDAGVVEAAAPEWTVENLALSGCALSEQAVLLPRLLKAGPKGVVVAINPVSLPIASDLAADKAYAYAMGRFAEAWPKGRTWRDIPGLTAETELRLRSSALDQSLHMRTSPKQALNLSLRESVRDDLAGGTENNWRSPHVMQSDFTSERLEWHAETVLRSTEPWTEAGMTANFGLVWRMLAEIRASGARGVVLVAPVHPRLRPRLDGIRPELAAALEEWRADGETTIVDAWELLEPSQFADVLHPNERGRIALSECLGRALATGGSSGSSPSDRMPRRIVENPRPQTR